RIRGTESDAVRTFAQLRGRREAPVSIGISRGGANEDAIVVDIYRGIGLAARAGESRTGVISHPAAEQRTRDRTHIIPRAAQRGRSGGRGGIEIKGERGGLRTFVAGCIHGAEGDAVRTFVQVRGR